MKKLESIRAEIAAVNAEIESLHTAPLERSEAIANIEDFIAEQARLSTFDASGFANRRGAPRSLPAPVVAPGLEPTESANIAPLAVVLAPELIRNRLIELMDAAVGTSYGPPSTKRAERLVKLEDELLSLERREEAEAVRLEATGVVVERRPNIRHVMVLVEAA